MLYFKDQLSVRGSVATVGHTPRESLCHSAAALSLSALRWSVNSLHDPNNKAFITLMVNL